MRTQALIDELLKIHPKGFDLSLDRVKRLLARLDNPQLRIPPAIHVAGTNGKGSTIAFCRSILEAAGYSVHVHTSPHLVNWQERYRLGRKGEPGQLVDDDTLADAISRVAEANGGEPITLFEILSVVMFVLFSEHEADFSLVEVGLGGRFDATNVIEEPLISVIAPVALDHQAYLGDTIAKIAFEKAGIIKANCPVAIGLQEDDALETIVKRAEEENSPMIICGQDYDCYAQNGRFIYNDGEGLLDLPLPSLSGEHQIDNAGLAIAAMRLAGLDIADSAFETAMGSTRWAGRMEQLPKGRIAEQLPGSVLCWIDGGHNPAAGQAIAAHLQSLKATTSLPVTLVTAMLTTKEPGGYFKPFAGIADKVLTLPITSSEAGFSPNELAKHAGEAGLNATPMQTLDEAVQHIAHTNNPETGQIVVFCGSLYHVGHVLEENGTPPE